MYNICLCEQQENVCARIYACKKVSDMQKKIIQKEFCGKIFLFFFCISGYLFHSKIRLVFNLGNSETRLSW